MPLIGQHPCSADLTCKLASDRCFAWCNCCMHNQTLARTLVSSHNSARRIDSAGLSGIPRWTHRATAVHRKSRLDHVSQLNRRQAVAQVSRTASLGLFSWLPFARMSAKAEFHPQQKWWRPDTVAVVTGGQHLLISFVMQHQRRQSVNWGLASHILRCCCS